MYRAESSSFRNQSIFFKTRFKQIKDRQQGIGQTRKQGRLSWKCRLLDLILGGTHPLTHLMSSFKINSSNRNFQLNCPCFLVCPIPCWGSWICLTIVLRFPFGTYLAFAPSSIYSCSIDHIWEHEFCHLGCWAVSENFLKRRNFCLSKQLFEVFFSGFEGQKTFFFKFYSVRTKKLLNKKNLKNGKK